jgi:hypothetical protein
MAPVHPQNAEKSINWFKRFQYDEKRDSPSDIRNVLLVIAILIAAMTFQAGVNPPGGVRQDDSGIKPAAGANPPTPVGEWQEYNVTKLAAGANSPSPGGKNNKEQNHAAGRAIYGSQKTPFNVFLMSNTLAFSSSLLVITSLTYGFPFHFEIWVATASMMVTYASAIDAVTPHESESEHFDRYLLITASVPFITRFLIQTHKKYRQSKKPGQINCQKDEEIGGKQACKRREKSYGQGQHKLAHF